MRYWAWGLGLLLLAGCGGGGGTEGGLTAEENAELNNAATMLDTAPETLPPLDEPADVGAAGNAATGNLPVTSEAATEGQ